MSPFCGEECHVLGRDADHGDDVGDGWYGDLAGHHSLHELRAG